MTAIPGIPPIGEHRHETDGSAMHRFVEKFEDIFILIAMLTGLHQRPNAGSEEEGSISRWVLDLLPFLSLDDEAEFLSALYSLTPAMREAEAEFRDRFIAEGRWDRIHYRLMIVKMRRHFIKELNHPAPENKSASMTFSPLKIRDSVRAFFADILKAKKAGGSKEEIYRRQKELAINREVLKKTGVFKKIAHWLHDNKLKIVLLLVVGTFFLLTLICKTIEKY